MRQDLNAEGEILQLPGVAVDAVAADHIKIGDRALAVEYRSAAALIPFAKMLVRIRMVR